MGEVYVKCVECGELMEETKHELAWDSYYIHVIPCNNCMANLEADLREEYERRG